MAPEAPFTTTHPPYSVGIVGRHGNCYLGDGEGHTSHPKRTQTLCPIRSSYSFPLPPPPLNLIGSYQEEGGEEGMGGKGRRGEWCG